MNQDTSSSQVGSDNRLFIRHPTDIPIEFSCTDNPSSKSDHIHDISMGGLSFHSDHYIEPKQWIHLHIPIKNQSFEMDAQVRWCHQQDEFNYSVGVLFSSLDTAYAARMVEQVCHIEHYRKQVLNEEGRQLSSEQAAAEWIEKFAAEFAQPNSETNTEIHE